MTTNTSQQIREWITTQTDFPLMSQICAGIGHANSIGAMKLVSEMARKGQLLRHGRPGSYRYSIGRAPQKGGGSKPRNPKPERAPSPPRLTAEERAARRRAYEAKRTATRQAIRATKKPADQQPTVRRQAVNVVTKQQALPAMDSREWEQLGGVVERLPVEWPVHYPPRRPVAGPGVQVAI